MATKANSSNIPQTVAMSKGYNFASCWEQNAPLTEQQQAAIQTLSRAVSERPYPVNMASDHVLGQDNSRSTDPSKGSALMESEEDTDAVLVNTSQFYKWFSDLESAMKSETEEKYQHYVSSLTHRIQTCDEILQEVDETLSLFDVLQLHHQAVSTKTKTLHEACDELVVEKQRLIEFAGAIHNKLHYFDELENVAAKLYSPNVRVDCENFLPLLKRLDDCLSYVESNPQYAESGVYLLKFRQLQSRALSMVRSHVHHILKGASSQVQAAIHAGGGGAKSFVSEGVETSVIYVRFKAAASELKPVLEAIEVRSSRKEYAQILKECHKLYCEQRFSLIKGIVHQRMSTFAKKEALQSLTRSGCAYLTQICQLEHQLFEHFFPLSSEDVSNSAPLINPLSTCLYDTLRPKIIHETHVDSLCELVDILKVELSREHNKRSDSFVGINPTLQRILEDVRERLTFRARAHIRDEIASYVPSDEDLISLSKLVQNIDSESETNADGNPSMLSAWYPPLEKTVSCLSKLYQCLEQSVFTGLAQEAVEICVRCIQKASKLIGKKISTMDEQLFLIKHLLILREQIAPFDTEFLVTYKELDFSHLLENIRRILKGQASIFDWPRSASLARTLSPRVLENHVDSKKELDKCLKVTCEEFIMSVTKLVVDPLLSFVTKVTAVKVALSSGSQHQINPVMAKQLKDHAFAAPDTVAELLRKVNATAQKKLASVMAKMKLYLQNPSTRTILFKPIKTNIVEAHIQVNLLVKAEYSPEEQSIISMVSIQDLETLLNIIG